VDGNAWVAGGGSPTDGPKQENSNVEFAVASGSSNTDVAQSFQLDTSAPLKRVELLVKKVGNLNHDFELKVVNDVAGSPGTDVLIAKTISKSDFSSTTQWLSVEFDIGPNLIAGQPYWLVLDSPTFNGSKYIAWSFDNTDSYPGGNAKKSSDMVTAPWVQLTGDFAFRTFTGVGDTFIRKVEVNGNLHAHSIERSIVHGDAFYQVKDSHTVVDGTSAIAPDPETKPFPISDGDINIWKLDIETDGTIISNDVEISGTQTIGNTKIVGNLSISGHGQLILSGNLWVTGNISFTNPGAVVSLDPAVYGDNTSGVLLADGKIDVNNNTTITGSGADNTFILVLSTNNSLDPTSPAINVANNSDSVIFYANNGMVRLYNGSIQNGTAGYYVRLEEICKIIYDPNLNNFTVPGGGDDEIGTQVGTWQEQ
ncbi:MAG: hypothetical protein V1838_01385, partial [Patescibacteria group bacterium]